ncbi:MAG: DUF512 domain-containing protein [Oscillospiraceae bacterium]
MPVNIQDIEKGSPAENAGLLPGMCIYKIDGHEIRDGLDYEFYSSPARYIVEVLENGQTHKYTVSKQEYQPLGCVFGTYLIDKQHTCKNKCVFCFVDQMPKGMRKSLYFKDDDERLSFLFGNYVTLTNLSQREVDRIIEMRISPINISVHAANPEVRVKMMKNIHSGEVLKYIPKLAAAGIALNTQLVLCPGINDGKELRNSIEWLAQFRPSLESIAAVPVGVTKYRDNLPQLDTYTKETAAEQLDIMLEYGDRFAAEAGQRTVYPSDEWFLKAERPIPPEEFYDGYLQLENGVGMWRLLYDEFTQELERYSGAPSVEYDLATGALAAPLLAELAQKLKEKFMQANIKVHCVKNDFFGHGVTVAGLLTGQDIINQLKGKLTSKVLLLPDVMLRAEGDLFLDDISPADVEEALGVKIRFVPRDGASLLAAMLEK